MKTNIGVTVSFYQLMKEPGFRVRIPMIQRDYVQGRDSAKEVRENFLRNIKKHLDNEEYLHLDLVYGTIENGAFIPIDGQQRLTTLFLLHWYLAIKSGNRRHLSIYLGESNSRFTYETRISSRDFCSRLVVEDISFNSTKSISEIIMDQAWFYLNWKHDATIMGMLNTLNSIEEILSPIGSYYEKLIHESSPLVTFEYIELTELGLSDDQLYIKMNSRGKPLTAFENIKANIEDVFENYDKSQNTSITEWFTQNIDKDWTDFFWNHLPENDTDSDRLFLNFIRACLINRYALKPNFIPQNLSELLDDKIPLSYFMMERMDLNDVESIRDVFFRLELLIQSEGQPLILKEWINGETLFKSLIFNDRFSYTKRIQFYAINSYLLNYKRSEGLKDWVRVIRNLSENSRIEVQEEFVSALISTNQLMNHAENILDYLSNSKPSDISAFSRVQVKEEIIKAKALLGSEIWLMEILKAENHPYLQGSIGFLLTFSEVVKSLKDEDWELISLKSEQLQKFQFYYHQFWLLFGEQGIRPEFENYVVERALLATHDYLLESRRNYSFVINGNDRYLSWKAFFGHENVTVLKELFDQIDPQNVNGSLTEIINRFDRKDDWRYFFVKYPQLIDATGFYKFVRWYDEKHILLLEKTQTNGRHSEYYSKAIQCELEEKGFYVEYRTDSYELLGSKYIEKINDKDIYICYIPHDIDEGYWIESSLIIDKEIKLSTHDEVIQTIVNLFNKP